MAKKESYRNVRRENYTQVTNSLLNDKEATLQAKGLLSIFLSNSDDWEIHMDEIITRSKNGRDAHYKVVNELIELGYFARIQVMNSSSNRFEEMIYLFSDIKQDVADEIENIKKWAKENEKNLIIEYKTKKEKKKKKTPFPENQETDKNPITDFQETENELTETQYNNNTKLNNINLKKKKEEEEEKASSIQLEKSVKEYLTNELKYNSTLLSEIAEQMASFSVDGFTKAEMKSQHNYMVKKNKSERITEWAFYFVNGIVLKRSNPKNEVAATSNEKKRTGSAKKAIRTEMVPDWLHTDKKEQETKDQKKAITDEYKKKVWEQVKSLEKSNNTIQNTNLKNVLTTSF
jgi:hypothetical protein